MTLLAWSSPAAEELLNLALLLYGAAPILALLTCRYRRLGAGATVLGLIGILLLALSWFREPMVLAFLVVPALLAALSLGPAATALVALLQTVMLGLLPRVFGPEVTPAGVVPIMGAIWCSVAILWAMRRSVNELARWSWEHFSRAQSLLEEARDRQVELKETLDALARANRELALMNEKLATLRLVAENAQKAKATFVSSVSHEFRTPLNIIIGLTELLMDAPRVFGEALGPKTQEAVATLYRNCEHLSSMIEDVLDLSQVEAGRLAIRKEYVDLRQLVRNALGVILPLLTRKGLSIEVSMPDTLPEVYCDATRIRQVLLNLVSNATRFTEQGGISVAVSVEDGHVVVSVRDTGPGIAPEEAARIFEPFRQATETQRRGGVGGHGLGLAISKQFVEMHHGKMWLESEMGQGSTFFFKLPISPPPEPLAPPERWIKEGWVTRSSRVPLPVARLAERMILFDESGELRPVFARYADDTEFVEARTLGDTVCRAREMPAQAILVNSPTEADLLERLRLIGVELPDIPIIGYCLPQKNAHALCAGAIGYLLKPVHRADLQRILASVAQPIGRVLIVDDEEDTLWFLEQLVGVCDESIQVSTAASAGEALAKMRSWRPDLVLLDIVLPDMDGWQLLTIKAQEEALVDIPVAIVSAQDPYEGPAASEQEGSDQLSSPVLATTMGDGLAIGKLLRCAQIISALLLQPD
ncbi:MAG: response regulator [Chloroflexi bacterium]|nr:response regulator [Chloroflexota bacterium]